MPEWSDAITTIDGHNIYQDDNINSLTNKAFGTDTGGTTNSVVVITTDQGIAITDQMDIPSDSSLWYMINEDGNIVQIPFNNEDEQNNTNNLILPEDTQILAD